ncbi:diaminopimelate epimerase [Allobranchiibius sp. GilTou73]|uniref:diaminopimelate epimerase n=1 Tax=Allobranchiibius sp. GilTou73 TaxID=2904523 RepID=UPI001F41CD74|nr:diaminopimelate epimerase [Allobranchiibius sp. GilTou73]UIJ33455.1 diaminopimelate epimerase [Allobranchiibius sp. GilTou73]
MPTVDFVKGHGTMNDFVLVADLDGALSLTAADVGFLADRHAGIGGDGVIRVTRTESVADAPADIDPQLWFMDYYNADGSAAEMCGNGTRVFARYLVEHGLASGPSFEIGTRAGVKRIDLVGDGYSTDLGPWRLSRADEAAERGMDAVVQVVGAPDALPALSLDLGNPHTVVALPPSMDLGTLDLQRAPHVDPRPFDGTNVEFVRAHGPGHISMRVFERGVGETLSCGTGAAAAALATWWWSGQSPDQLQWMVDVPGGRLGVLIDGDRVSLSGPAALVADGRVSLPG